MKYKNLHKLVSKYRLILASGSPRRKRLLTEAGIKFEQIIPFIDENNSKADSPVDLALVLAQKKAEAVRNGLNINSIALGCDTIVIINNRILGKPSTPEEAFEMLSLLSGNRHTVCSAITLLDSKGRAVSGFELTNVYFNKDVNSRLHKYIETGEPMDKAGAYGIQGVGGFLVDRIEGNLDNVIGLPMILLDELAGRILEIQGV